MSCNVQLVFRELFSACCFPWVVFREFFPWVFSVSCNWFSLSCDWFSACCFPWVVFRELSVGVLPVCLNFCVFVYYCSGYSRPLGIPVIMKPNTQTLDIPVVGIPGYGYSRMWVFPTWIGAILSNFFVFLYFHFASFVYTYKYRPDLLILIFLTR